MFKRFLALLMCIVLMCGMGVVASAEGTSSAEYTANVSESGENQVQPRYTYTSGISATLANSNGKAWCIGDVEGYEGETTKIVLTVTLQKRTLLLFWSDEKEWTTTSTNYFATISKTVAVDSGTYRVKVEATVYSGSKSETVDCTSQTCEF